ncbi:Mannose-P-dolichol utilization defect 1 -like protein, partial [Trichinella britovi]
LLENCNVEKLNLRMFRTEQHRPSRCDLARGWWMKVADNGCLRHCASCASTKYLKKPPDGRARQMTIARSKIVDIDSQLTCFERAAHWRPSSIYLATNARRKREEQLPRAECVSLVCSRLLGVGIVAGASLVLYYYKRFIALTVVSSFYGFCCYHVYNGSVWENVLDSVQMMTIVIMFIARATQAVDNYIHKSTGQLSAVTYILLFLGSLARIFTSVKETGDNMIIAQYMMSTLMNLFICLQIQLYWGNKRSLKTE